MAYSTSHDEKYDKVGEDLITTARNSTFTPTGAPRHRRTRQRRAVEEVLAGQGEFRTAQQVHDELTRRGASVGLTTVYRTLQSMAHADEVDAIRTEDGEAAYRRCSTGHHHHMVCRSCGHTVEVIGPTVERWADNIADRNGFRSVRRDLKIFGTCSHC